MKTSPENGGRRDPTMTPQETLDLATARFDAIESQIPAAKGAHRDCLGVARLAWGNVKITAKSALKHDRRIPKMLDRLAAAQEIDRRLAADFG